MARSNNAPFVFAAELVHETDLAYLIDDGDLQVWLPKSQTQRVGDSEFQIPEWLAIKEGLT